jgi:hypothetical protein
VTLYFLRSNNVRYLQAQIDPLFATDFNYTRNSTFENETTTTRYYTKALPAASSLGCVSTYEVCVSTTFGGYVCADVTKISKPGDRGSNATSQTTNERSWSSPLYSAIVALAFTSDRYADAYSAQLTIGIQGLDALNKMVVSGLSIGLPDNQWEIEAQKIFNISLARYQLNAWSIARGERFGEGMPEVDALKGNPCAEQGCQKLLCQSLKIEGVGWRNISLSWFVTLLTLSIFSVIGSTEVGETLILVWFCKRIFLLLGFFWRSVAVPMYRKLSNVRRRENWARWAGSPQIAACRFQWFRVPFKKTRTAPNSARSNPVLS